MLYWQRNFFFKLSSKCEKESEKAEAAIRDSRDTKENDSIAWVSIIGIAHEWRVTYGNDAEGKNKGNDSYAFTRDDFRKLCFTNCGLTFITWLLHYSKKIINWSILYIIGAWWHIIPYVTQSRIFLTVFFIRVYFRSCNKNSFEISIRWQ